MYRTSNEAMCDTVTRPIIPYKAPISWNEIKEGQYERIKANEICAKCFSVLQSFNDSFIMNAGLNCIFLVTEKSGLCRECFELLQKNNPVYKSVPRVKINYAYGTEELQIIEDE